MKSLLTLLLLVPAVLMIAVPSALADAGDIHYERSVVVNPGDHEGLNPAIVATSWKGSGKYGYYDRWDHRHRSHSYFDRHRHGHINPRFYGHRHYHSPYRPHPFHGKQYYYHRPYRGGHFGFSACYRSGSIRVCINESYPYRYRYR